MRIALCNWSKVFISIYTYFFLRKWHANHPRTVFENWFLCGVTFYNVSQNPKIIVVWFRYLRKTNAAMSFGSKLAQLKHYLIEPFLWQICHRVGPNNKVFNITTTKSKNRINFSGFIIGHYSRKWFHCINHYLYIGSNLI